MHVLTERSSQATKPVPTNSCSSSAGCIQLQRTAEDRQSLTLFECLQDLLVVKGLLQPLHNHTQVSLQECSSS